MKILIIDDDPDLSRLLTRFLERNGFSTFAVPDAVQGWEVLQREDIGLVITDLMMPHMDGLSFTERIRKDGRFADLPVLLLTAYPSDDLTDTGLRKGISMTLAKPVDFDRLLTLVRFAQ